MRTTLFRFAFILSIPVLIGLVIPGCKPADEGKAFDNLAPSARLANVPPNDPTTDTTGNDGYWNIATDDLGKDGLSDAQETGCTGSYDPVTNPDPAFDNLDATKQDLCPPDSGSFKSDPALYTQNNGRPDVGEPHVTKPRPFKSPLVKLYWVGNDPDGYVTAFMYRWTYKDNYDDTTFQVRPWTTVLNYVTNDNDHLILMLDVPETSAPAAAIEIFKYFTNTDLDPEKRNPSSPNYDTALVNTYERLATGKVSFIKGYRVYASNPRGNRYPVHESPNAGTFIFESDDFLNRHAFEIRAIDNEMAVGRSDTVRFWTPSVEAPRVTLNYALKASPSPSDTNFILDQTTYTWPGIKFTFNASDRNSRTITYSWKVDNKDWKPFTSDVIARVTAGDVDTPYTGVHLFQVRARNEFGTISVPDSLSRSRFITVYPRFAEPNWPKRVLLVSVNKNPSLPSQSLSNRPEAEVMQFYKDIFTSLGIPYDVYIPTGIGHPTYAKMAEYSTIYPIMDNLPPGDIYKQLPATRYANYLGAGGTMIMNSVAWPAISSVIISPPDSLMILRFQLRDVSPSFTSDGTFVGGSFDINREFDCIGAFADPRAGYPRLEVDPAKCDPLDSGLVPNTIVAQDGKLRRIYKCQPQGFAETIYRYDSATDSVGWENEILGIRYIGATYRTVWFGLPLFYIKQDQSQAAIRKAMVDLGYQF
jgi:hypothetical protein